MLITIEEKPRRNRGLCLQSEGERRLRRSPYAVISFSQTEMFPRSGGTDGAGYRPPLPEIRRPG